jgi:nucleotide-binding universal stress UspA family protein
MAVQQCCYVAIHNVAVATDFSDCSERAILHAVGMAKKFGAALHFLNLVQPSKFAAIPEMIPEIDKAAGRDCDDLITRLKRSHDLNGIECHRWVEQGEVFEVVSDFIRNHSIDLLVIGTQDRGVLSRLLFGSVSQEILSYVHCPVLTVGPCSHCPDSQLQLKRVLFATDLSAESLAALPYVLTSAREWQAELDVLHVCSSKDANCPGRMPQQMTDLRAKIEASQEASGLTIRYHQLAGKPASSILDFARNNRQDLIVLGLKPHRGVYNGSAWSHAYEVVREASCPVLRVPAD